jgi:hypothetical protein
MADKFVASGLKDCMAIKLITNPAITRRHSSINAVK